MSDENTDDIKYNDEGIPICPNCEKSAKECDCWDFVVVHAILAYRIGNGILDSEHLQPKVDDDSDDNEDDESDASEEDK